MLLHNSGSYPYDQTPPIGFHPSTVPLSDTNFLHFASHSLSAPQPIFPTEDFGGLGLSHTPHCVNPSLPCQQAATYPLGLDFQQHPPTDLFSCPCTPVPTHQTFLHQILTGQGYRNNAVADHMSMNLGKMMDCAANALSTSPSSASSINSPANSTFGSFGGSADDLSDSCFKSSCCFGNLVKPSGFSSIQLGS